MSTKKYIIETLALAHHFGANGVVDFVDSILSMHVNDPARYPTPKQWAWVQHYHNKYDIKAFQEALSKEEAKPNLQLVF